MSVFAAEADVFDIMAGRYSASGVTNLGVFLKSHAGDHIRVDRITRETVIVKNPALTVGLAVQPDVVEGLAARKEFRGRGLTPRFLYSLPASNIGRREVDPPPVPKQVRKQYEAHLAALLGETPVMVDLEYRPYVIRLDEAARHRILEFAAEIEPQLPSGADLGLIAEWGSKLVGAVGRIAGLLHLADRANQPKPWMDPVDPETIARAIEIGRYLVPHAKAAFALMGADPDISDARYIVAVIQKRGWTEFSGRDLFEVTKGRFKKVDRMLPGLSLVVEHGYAREQEPPPRQGPGRSPSPRFEANPLIGSHNSQNSHKPEEANDGDDV